MPDSWTDGLAYEVMGTPVWAYVALVATFVGTYTIEAWHERYETMEHTVTLGDKETQALEFTYGS